MPWNPESSEIFQDITKTEIFVSAQDEIAKQLERAKKFPVEERSIIAFGATFEALAVNENLKNHPETEKQREIRDLIQTMYQKAEIALGKHWPSKPDFVSIHFDGVVTIDEIIEMKTSEQALKHGLAKGQPENALKTVEGIVDLLNQMISAQDTNQVKILKELTGKYDQYRKKFLIDIYNRVKALELHDNIRFDPDLQYHVILAADAQDVKPDFKVSLNNKPVRVVVSKSRFSKNDVHKIIDHFAETP